MARHKWTYRALRRDPGMPGIKAWVEWHTQRSNRFGELVGAIEKRPLHHFVQHSPTGFEMGYGGSGPADLARSILIHWFLSYKLSMEEAVEEADARYQDFKWVFVAKERDSLSIRDDEIEAWLGRLSDFEQEESEQPTTKEG